jgi:hypothetical protein
MHLIDQLFRRSESLWFDKEPGRNGRFEAVAVSGGKRIPVVGTRLAREGLSFVSAVAVRGPELPLTFTIRRRSIPSRVRIVKDQAVREAKGVIHRYLCAFVTLAAEDREAVIRYVDDVPEPPAGSAPAPAPEFGAIAMHVQTEIAEELVRLKRLTPPAPGMAPLIRLDVEPERTLEDGRRARDVVVHSRLRTGNAVRSFQTRVRVFEDGRIDIKN